MGTSRAVVPTPHPCFYSLKAIEPEKRVAISGVLGDGLTGVWHGPRRRHCRGGLGCSAWTPGWDRPTEPHKASSSAGADAAGTVTRLRLMTASEIRSNAQNRGRSGACGGWTAARGPLKVPFLERACWPCRSARHGLFTGGPGRGVCLRNGWLRCSFCVSFVSLRTTP